MLRPGAGIEALTPADWAWIGGLFDRDVMGLRLGVAVVAARLPKFDAEACVRADPRCGVTAAFLPPRRCACCARPEVCSGPLGQLGGETLGAEPQDFKSRGVEINEFYGQTECNMIVSSAGSSMRPTRPRRDGLATPVSRSR